MKEFKDHKNPYAIVIGLDNVQGLQTARILNSHDIPVIAVAKNPKHYACFTNSCNHILFANTQNKEFIDLLQSLGPKLKQRGVLFPCEDATVLLLSKFRSRLAKWFEIIMPDHHIVETLLDKNKFYSYVKKNNLPVPKSFFINSLADAKVAANQLSYPAIIKPAVKNQKWNDFTHLKAFDIDSPSSLLRIYKTYSSFTNSFIAQKWIEGDDTNYFTCNCYFDRNSKPLVTFTTQKLRQWPPKTGQACFGFEVKNEQVLETTIELFEKINFYGLAYLEMKKDANNNQYYIIEANICRPTGRSATAEASGVSYLYTMYCDAIGRPLPQNIIQKYKKTKWIHLRRDMQSAFFHFHKKELKPINWLKSYKGPKTFALFSWKDPKPFIGDILRAMFLILIPRERKKRNYNNPAKHADELRHNEKSTIFAK